MSIVQLELPMALTPNARQPFIKVAWMVQCPTCEELYDYKEAWEHVGGGSCLGEAYDADPAMWDGMLAYRCPDRCRSWRVSEEAARNCCPTRRRQQMAEQNAATRPRPLRRRPRRWPPV